MIETGCWILKVGGGSIPLGPVKGYWDSKGPIGQYEKLPFI